MPDSLAATPVPAETTAPVPALTQEAALAAFDTALAGWVDGKIRNSVLAHSTEVWNYLHSVLPALRAAFIKEI